MKLNPDSYILEKLTKIDQSASNAYVGAFDVLRKKSNKERISQSAHSFREAVNLIIRKTQNMQKTEDDKVLRTRLINKFDPQGALPDAFQHSYAKLVTLHSWFTNVSHHGHRPSEKEYNTKINELHASLRDILRPHFESLDEIDILLKKRSPSASDIVKLKNLITNYAASKYFFERASKKWFPILRQNQIFRIPSALIREQNIVRFVYWPASSYLLKLTKEYPKEVYETLIECKIPRDSSDRNLFVIEEFLIIAMNMPIEYACKLVRHFLNNDWLDSPYYFPYQQSIQLKALELAMILLKEDRYEGKQIIDKFLSVKKIIREYTKDKRSEIFKDIEDFKINQFRFLDSYLLREIEDKYLPILFEKFPKSTFKLLLQILSDILATYDWIHNNFYLSRKGIYSLFATGYMNIPSTSWMRSVEEAMSDRDYLEPRASIAVDLIRGILYFEESPPKLTDFVKIFANYDFPVIRRLELWIYSRFPDIFNKQIDKSIIKYFNNYELYHEHYDLIKYNFFSRKKEVKQKYLKKVKAYEQHLIKEYKKFNYPKDKMDVDILHWKLRTFEPIIDSIPKKEKIWYQSQLKKGYKVALPGFHYEISVKRGVQHGIDIGLTLDMEPEQVIQVINEYIRSDKYGDYDDITSTKFREAIKNKPYEFSILGKRIIDLNLEYCYQYISAIDESISTKKKISWPDVLDVCEFLLKQSTPPYKFSSRFGNSITSLLINGMSGFGGIPFSNREKIWSMIELIITNSEEEDRLSFLNDEKEIRDEYSHLVYNSNKGLSIELLLDYIVWCYDCLDKKMGMVDEGKNLLEKLLAKSKSLETLGPICFNLNSLILIEKSWVIQNLQNILISYEDNRVLHYALWECYLVRNLCTNQTFDIVFPFILKRIENLRNDPKSYFKSQATINLILFIARAYLFKLKKADELLNYFLRKAPKQLISLFISEIGHVLRRHKRGLKIDFNMERLKDIWEIEQLQNEPGFLIWFVNSPFDKRYSISKLYQFLERNHDNFAIFPSDILLFNSIMQELKSYIIEEPATTLNCISFLSSIANKKGLLLNIKGIVYESIKLIEKDDSEFINAIQDIKDFYGRCGFTEFRN